VQTKCLKFAKFDLKIDANSSSYFKIEVVKKGHKIYNPVFI